MDPVLLMKIFRAALSLDDLRASGALAHLRDDIAKLSLALTTKPDGSVYTREEMQAHLDASRANFQAAIDG